MKNMKKSSLILLIVVAVVLFVVLPFTGSAYLLNILTLMCLYLAMSQMWNLLGGYAGMLSLGMQAFIGLGGYTLTILSVNYGVNIYLSIIIGAVICMLFGLAVSPAIFKMSGVYFAIGTWIIAEALNIFFSNWKFVGYAKDWSINTVYSMSYKQLYYTALVMAVLATLIVYCLLRTKTGLALMAIRDSASAAEVMGVELYKTKIRCYMIACFMMGLIGGAQYMQTAYINPSTGFSINWTIAMTFAVIIGGLGTMEGPIVGSVLYVIIVQIMYNFTGMSNIVLGIIAIVVILVAPDGIMGTIYKKTGFQILSPRRSIPKE
ncbi:MAG: branched-chain amino acid ABC transporter permease [Lachnospiraceae bacterium]|nr:branched-chain amino acid ABC transporter permease [Lachnospiraceae bacterium]